MKHVIITGADGFVGSYTVNYFLEVIREGTDEDLHQFYIHERKWVNELGKRGFS